MIKRKSRLIDMKHFERTPEEIRTYMDSGMQFIYLPWFTHLEKP